MIALWILGGLTALVIIPSMSVFLLILGIGMTVNHIARSEYEDE